MRWRVLLLMLAALACLATSAAAQDTTLREKVESAMRARDLERAVDDLTAALDGVDSPTVLVQGAEVSLELLPRPLGNGLAVAFARKALDRAEGKDAALAWRTAMAVRRRVVTEDGDLELGEPFLRLLMDHYASNDKQVPKAFRFDLAQLYAGASRQEEAMGAYQELLAEFPTDTKAAQELARIHEDRGELETSVATLTTALDALGEEPRSRAALELLHQRALLRLHSQRRYDEAQADLELALEVTGRLPSGPVRNDWAALFEAELDLLAVARRRSSDVKERLAGVDRALLAAALWILVVLGAGIGLGRVRGAL